MGLINENIQTQLTEIVYSMLTNTFTNIELLEKANAYNTLEHKKMACYIC